MTSREITFRPLSVSDLPMLLEWLACPHVVEWWGAPPASLADLVAEYTPALAGIVQQWCYVAYLGEQQPTTSPTPLGFIQAYAPVAFHDEGWWRDEHDPGVRGIDQFLADPDRLGRGLGTAMVRAFVAQLFADASVTRVQTDPDPTNLRAIRCYEKAGFRRAGEVDTPDGRALLLYADRPQARHADA
jgi:RimJ/RimL family protein N-acetyltransferase